MSYKLAEGHDAVSLTDMIDIVVDTRRLAHITSLGTYAAAAEFTGLDGIVQDMGTDTFTWTFEWMWPEEIAYIRTTFLNGARSGNVTVETLNEDGDDFVEVNAVLTLPRIKNRRGETLGPIVFTFTQASAT